MSSELYEPILDEKNQKFTAFPIQYHDIWDEYKAQFEQFWGPPEVKFINDHDDFITLSADEQHFIKMVLAFFASSDGIVNWNLSERFTKEVKITEALFAYQFQMMMENIHSEVYSLMLENIVKNEAEKKMLFDAIHTVSSVKKMAEWALEWIESSKSFGHRLIAFAVVEGIFFSGAFASIFWIKKYKNNTDPGSKPFMFGLTHSNYLISKDEALHCRFACTLYKHVQNKVPVNDVNEIFRSAVKIAQEFMTDALPVRLIGINQDMMNQYIEYHADVIINMLGYKKIFNKENPFKFMETIGSTNKSNFFEVDPSEYKKNSSSPIEIKKGIVIDDDF